MKFLADIYNHPPGFRFYHYTKQGIMSGEENVSTTYRSGIGMGLLLMSLIALSALGLLLFFMIQDYAWIRWIPFGLVVGYLIFLYVRTKYCITTDNRLIVQTGFKKKEIDIFQISSLRPIIYYFTTANVYALSEKRIRVVYGYGGYIDISPQHQEQFVEDLLTINPQIQLQGVVSS